MPVSERDFEALVGRVDALEARGAASRPNPQRIIKIKRRCGHEERVPTTMLAGSELEKKTLQSERGKYCTECSETRRKADAIQVAKLRGEDRNAEADALEKKIGVMTTNG